MIVSKDYLDACVYIVDTSTEIPTVYTYCLPEEAEKEQKLAQEKAANDAVLFLEYADTYTHFEPGYWKNRAETESKRKYEIMDRAEFCRRERAAILAMPLHEITREDYYRQLNVLPPLRWIQGDSMEMFCMSEMWTGTYTDQYLYDRRTGKYYCKLVDVCDPSTWIPNYLPENPLKVYFQSEVSA